MEKSLINITNIFIDIIISSVSKFEKVYGHYNTEILKNYYIKIPYNKNINIVKHCFVGTESLENDKIFYFCCFSDYNLNNKENGYIISLEEWNKICKKYNIVFIPQIEKFDDGFLFISDIFYIKSKEKKIKISAEELINKYNKEFRNYFINYVNLTNNINYF